MGAVAAGRVALVWLSGIVTMSLSLIGLLKTGGQIWRGETAAFSPPLCLVFLALFVSGLVAAKRPGPADADTSSPSNVGPGRPTDSNLQNLQSTPDQPTPKEEHDHG